MKSLLHTGAGVKRGVTLAETIAIAAIVIVLGAILFPVFPQGHTRRVARQTACQSNMKQILTSLQMYVQDYDERLPPHTARTANRAAVLPSLLQRPPRISNERLWRCPEDRRAGADWDGTGADTEVSYGYNWQALSPHSKGMHYAQIGKPGETVAFADSCSYLVTPGPPGGTGVAARHPGARVVAGWLDGHVRSMRYRELLVTATEEDGKLLRPGIDSYPLWNRR